MKKIQALVAITALSLAAGCSKADRSPPSASAPIAAGAVAADAIATKTTTDTDGVASKGPSPSARANRALIVTGEIHVKTQNVASASQRLRAEVERAGGYVSDAQESGSGDGRHAVIEIRVPAEKLRSLRTSLSDLGEITSDVEKVEDVTEARADLQARLQNARVEERRITEILEKKTAGLSDVLSAERELSRVREKIEQLEAQERTMERKIALATLKVTLEGPTPTPNVKHEPEAWETPGKSIAGAFRAGLKGTAAAAVYAAMVLAATSPVTVPLGIVLAFTLRLLKRKKQAALLAAGNAG